MIRINLIGQRKRTQLKEGSQLWLGVVLGLMLLEIIALFVFHGLKAEELAEQERKNRELSSQIDQSKKSIGEHTAVRDKLAQLRAREEAIGNLQTARTGPTAVLLELSRILTPSKGPTIDAARLNQLRRDNPLSAYNPAWDPHRLWLTSYKEDRRRLRVDGLARDGEDVSELARRMSLSDYFANVRLLPAKRDVDPATKIEVVKFSLEAEVKY